MFEGFVPVNHYFYLSENYTKKALNSKRSRKAQEENPKIKEAIQQEIDFLTNDGLSQKEMDFKKRSESDTVSLDFITNDEELTAKYQAIIEREINKTPEMKMKDFNTINPTLGMVQGGANDVFASVLQVLACMSTFVKYFIAEDYKEDVEGLKEGKPFCDMMSRVFSILWRRDDIGMAAPWISISFVQDMMKKFLPYTQNHCAVVVLKHMLENLTNEIIPQDIVERVMHKDRTNEDIEAFHNYGIVNKSFSFLQVRIFTCNKGHESQTLSTTIGLNPRKGKRDEKLTHILKDMFALKQSKMKCPECGRR